MEISVDFGTVILFFAVLIPLLYLFGFGTYKNLPPGPFKWPYIGNFIQVKRAEPYTAELFLSLAKEYGPIYHLKMAHMNMIFINDYDMIKEAYVKMSDTFGYRPAWLPVPKMILQGRGVINANGSQWKERRKFTMHGLRDFGMGKKSIEHKIQEEGHFMADEIRSYKEKAWDPRILLLNSVSNITCNVIFGHRYEYSDTRFQNIVDNLHYVLHNITFSNPALSSVFLAKLSPKIHDLMNRMSLTNKLVEEEIAEHRATFDPNNIRDFTDLFLQQLTEKGGNDVLSETQMYGIITDVFMAGTDTTSTSLYWGLLFMIAHPEVQQKCQDEIDKEVGRSRQIAMSDRPNMPYIEATISETQRLASIAPTNVPHTTFEDVEFHGYTIPKRSLILGNIFAVHHNPKYFGDDVEAFRPERWLDPDGKYVKNEHLIPFSIGSRVCLGEQLAKMELFLTFPSLLQLFTFQKEAGVTKVDTAGITGAVRAPPKYKLITKER